VMLRFGFAMFLGSVLLCGCSSRSDREASDKDAVPPATAHAKNVKFDDMSWAKLAPTIGEDSPEITILDIDSTAHATKLMIRVPSGFTVPAHWHSANETHTVVQGTFIMECEGMRDTLTVGSFNFIPKRMPHRAWTLDKEGALLFITVDGPWDVNFVDGPPDWPKLRNPAVSKHSI
jgi:quercetin dioxygenase-like cupin family protein